MALSSSFSNRFLSASIFDVRKWLILNPKRNIRKSTNHVDSRWNATFLRFTRNLPVSQTEVYGLWILSHITTILWTVSGCELSVKVKFIEKWIYNYSVRRPYDLYYSSKAVVSAAFVYQWSLLPAAWLIENWSFLMLIFCISCLLGSF